MNRKKLGSFALQLKREKAEAKKLASEIRPQLEKDPDWPLATKSPVAAGELGRKRLALSRITKKAVRAMYQDYPVSVRLGSGTAHYWVMVDLKIPDPEARQKDAVRVRLENTLLALGIKYGSYYSDCGPGSDIPNPCLSITVNSAI